MAEIAPAGHGTRTKAFTLIELLVVIAIIGILIALLLPAVQKVRAAAQRMACANNLKNVGLALHHFENDNGCFPPGQVFGPFAPVNVPGGAQHGFWPFLLPYLEQQALFRQYSWQISWNNPANRDTIAVQLKILQCPSAQPNRTGESLNPSDPGACTDYVPLKGLDSSLRTLLSVQPNNYDGVFGKNFMPRITDIVDGTSNTIFVAESSGRPTLWRGNQPHLGFAGGGPWASVSNLSIITGSTPPDGSKSPGTCAVNCTNAVEIYSFHTSGANSLFGDGSVRFLNANLSIQVLAKLITRAGGETLSGDEF